MSSCVGYVPCVYYVMVDEWPCCLCDKSWDDLHVVFPYNPSCKIRSISFCYKNCCADYPCHMRELARNQEKLAVKITYLSNHYVQLFTIILLNTLKIIYGAERIPEVDLIVL